MAPNDRFMKANGRFIKPRQPVDHFTKANGRFIKRRQRVDHFITPRPFYRRFIKPRQRVDHFIKPVDHFIMKSLWRPGRTPHIEQSDSLSLLSLRFEGLPLGRQAVLANPKP